MADTEVPVSVNPKSAIRTAERIAARLAAKAVVGTLVTDIVVRNEVVSVLPAGQVAFAMAFLPGELPRGQRIAAAVGVGAVDAQTDVKATHADGSARHALVTIARPELAAGQEMKVRLKATRAMEAKPVNLGAAVKALKNAEVKLEVTQPAGMAGTYVADVKVLVAEALRTAPDYWMRGPQASQLRVMWYPRPAKESSLRVPIDVTVWANGDVTLDVSFNNDIAMMKPTVYHGTVHYVASAMLDGEEVLPPTPVQHGQYQCWHRKLHKATAVSGWVGHRDSLNVVIPMSRLAATKVILDIDPALTLPAKVLTEYGAARANNPNWMRPLWNNGIEPYMPNGGDRRDIGPVPGPHSTWARTGDLRVALVARGWAEAGRAPVWNYWDETRKCPLGMKHYRNLWVHTSQAAEWRDPSSPLCEGVIQPRKARTGSIEEGAVWATDSAHPPATSFFPYAVTGERWIYDDLMAQAASTLVSYWQNERGNSPNYLNGDKDIFFRCQGKMHPNASPELRASVWSLRTISDASFVAVDGSVERAWTESIIDKNMKAVRAAIPLMEADFGSFKGWWLGNWGYGSYEMGPFQQEYMAHVLIQTARRGQATDDVKHILDWMFDNYFLGSFEQGSDFNWREALATRLAIAGVPSQPNSVHTSWAAVQADLIARGHNWRDTGPPPNAPYRFEGNYSILRLSTFGVGHRWYSDPAGGNKPSFVERIEAHSKTLLGAVPKMPYIELEAASGQQTFIYSKRGS